MVEIWIPILVFVGVIALGGCFILILSRRRPSLKPRLHLDPEADTETSLQEEQTDSRGRRALRPVTGLGRLFSLGKVSAKLQEHLARAGYYRESAALTFLGVKLLLLALGAAIITTLVIPLDMSAWIKGYLLVVIPAGLFFVPNLAVKIRRGRRATEIRQNLPVAVDLLEICVSAGMGLDTAWNAVSDEIRHVSVNLGDEMTLTNLEIQLGATRTVAMRNMAERIGAEELTGLVALLVQTERFGTSVADALRTFAQSMRETRSLRAEEAAEKMAVKLLFPLVFFIFPVMLIVMGGPAGITLYSVMYG